MKKIKYLFAGILLIIGFGGCMDDFIEKPSVTGLTVEEVFSSAKNVEGAIALAYSYNLSSGLPIYSWTPPYLPYEATEAIMGGEDVDSSWGYMKDNLVCRLLIITTKEPDLVMIIFLIIINTFVMPFW